MGDDGGLSLGEPLSGFERGSTLLSNGLQYSVAALRRVISPHKMRSMHVVMREIAEEVHAGIGSGSGEFGQPPDRLLPSSVKKHKPRQPDCSLRFRLLARFGLSRLIGVRAPELGLAMPIVRVIQQRTDLA